MQKNQIFLPTEVTSASYKALLPLFFEEISEDFDLIKKAVVSKSIDDIKSIAHKIKGTASTYSAAYICSQAKLLQEASEESCISDLVDIIKGLGESISYSQQYAKENLY